MPDNLFRPALSFFSSFDHDDDLFIDSPSAAQDDHCAHDPLSLHQALSLLPPGCCDENSFSFVHARDSAFHHRNKAALSLTLNAQDPSPTTSLAVSPRANNFGHAGEGSDREKRVREDAWSHVATTSLIEAWGERFKKRLHSHYGKLKQKDWEELAEAVNQNECAAGIHHVKRTDKQCKNRMDTLKKKYKRERIKAKTDGKSGTTWPFFHMLDAFIRASKDNGSSFHKDQKKIHALQEDPDLADLKVNSRVGNVPDINASESEYIIDDHIVGEKANAKASLSCSQEESTVDLVNEVLKLAEVFEKVETRKQQQWLDLAHWKMDYYKDMQQQVMKIYVQKYMEVAKIRFDANHHKTTTGNQRSRHIQPTSASKA